jgi:hypothetical protein
MEELRAIDIPLGESVLILFLLSDCVFPANAVAEQVTQLENDLRELERQASNRFVVFKMHVAAEVGAYLQRVEDSERERIRQTAELVVRSALEQAMQKK